MEYLIFIVLLYETAITSILGFSYIDELILLFLFICFFCKILKDKKIILTKNEFFILWGSIGIYCIGIISLLVFNISDNIKGSLFSGLLSLKSILTYIFVRYLFKDSKFRYNELFLKFTQFGLFCVFLLSLVDRVIPIFKRGSKRFGIYTTSLFFETPTMLATFAIISLIICTFLIRILNKKEKNLYIDVFMSLVIVLFAGRVKAIGFMILYLIVIFYKKFFKSNRGIKIKNFIIPLIIVICFASGYIENYFFNNTESRTIMLNTSIKIAKDYFPLGTGFGTFGTEMSRKYYSPLYSLYNISKVWGLSREFDSYIADSMLPAIIAETGFIGLAFYIFIFINFFINISKNVKNKDNQILLFLLIFYVLIECVADTLLMTSRGMLLFAFMAFITNYDLNKEEEK